MRVISAERSSWACSSIPLSLLPFTFLLNDCSDESNTVQQDCCVLFDRDVLFRQFLFNRGVMAAAWWGFAVSRVYLRLRPLLLTLCVDRWSNKEADSLSSAEEREVTTGTGASPILSPSLASCSLSPISSEFESETVSARTIAWLFVVGLHLFPVFSPSLVSRRVWSKDVDKVTVILQGCHQGVNCLYNVQQVHCSASLWGF